MEGGPPAYRYSSAEVFPKPNLHARFSNNLTQDLKTEKRKLMKQVKDVQDVKKMEEEGKTIGFGIQEYSKYMKTQKPADNTLMSEKFLDQMIGDYLNFCLPDFSSEQKQEEIPEGEEFLDPEEQIINNSMKDATFPPAAYTPPPKQHFSNQIQAHTAAPTPHQDHSASHAESSVILEERRSKSAAPAMNLSKISRISNQSSKVKISPPQGTKTFKTNKKLPTQVSAFYMETEEDEVLRGIREKGRKLLQQKLGQMVPSQDNDDTITLDSAEPPNDLDDELKELEVQAQMFKIKRRSVLSQKDIKQVSEPKQKNISSFRKSESFMSAASLASSPKIPFSGKNSPAGTEATTVTSMDDHGIFYSPSQELVEYQIENLAKIKLKHSPIHTEVVKGLLGVAHSYLAINNCEMCLEHCANASKINQTIQNKIRTEIANLSGSNQDPNASNYNNNPNMKVVFDLENQSLECESLKINVMMTMGLAQFKMGDYNEAEKTFENAFEIATSLERLQLQNDRMSDPNNKSKSPQKKLVIPPTYSITLMFLIGKVKASRGELEPAKKILEKALRFTQKKILVQKKAQNSSSNQENFAVESLSIPIFLQLGSIFMQCVKPMKEIFNIIEERRNSHTRRRGTPLSNRHAITARDSNNINFIPNPNPNISPSSGSMNPLQSPGSAFQFDFLEELIPHLKEREIYLKGAISFYEKAKKLVQKYKEQSFHLDEAHLSFILVDLYSQLFDDAVLVLKQRVQKKLQEKEQNPAQSSQESIGLSEEQKQFLKNSFENAENSLKICKNYQRYSGQYAESKYSASLKYFISWKLQIQIAIACTLVKAANFQIVIESELFEQNEEKPEKDEILDQEQQFLCAAQLLEEVCFVAETGTFYLEPLDLANVYKMLGTVYVQIIELEDEETVDHNTKKLQLKAAIQNYAESLRIYVRILGKSHPVSKNIVQRMANLTMCVEDEDKKSREKIFEEDEEEEGEADENEDPYEVGEEENEEEENSEEEVGEERIRAAKPNAI